MATSKRSPRWALEACDLRQTNYIAVTAHALMSPEERGADLAEVSIERLRIGSKSELSVRPSSPRCVRKLQSVSKNNQPAEAGLSCATSSVNRACVGAAQDRPDQGREAQEKRVRERRSKAQSRGTTAENLSMRPRSGSNRLRAPKPRLVWQRTQIVD